MAAKDFNDSEESQYYQRFSDIASEPCRMLLPVQGYEKKPLVSLEDAVEPLVPFVPDVMRMAYVAKMKCDNPPADNLSKDQSASIMLYSMEWEPHEECLYFVLNATLRAENRKKLVPWFLYLKLILTAFSHLPTLHRTVYRGIKRDMRKDYKKGETIIWWGFNSCTATMDVLQNDQFLGSTGTRTFFSIECISGKHIQQHSQFQNEDEILLPPGRQFKVAACLNQSGGLYMIQLQEIEPPYPLLEPISEDTPKILTNVSFTSSSATTSMSSLSISENKPKQKDTEDEQFAALGTYKPLMCKGRPCATCGKCRDWYYTDPTSWDWIQNYENWNKDDKDHYYHDKFHEHFRRRAHATCHHHHSHSHHTHGHGHHGHHGQHSQHGVHHGNSHHNHLRGGCLCEDNVKSDY